MKKTILLLLTLLCVSVFSLNAQSYKTAVGVRFSSNDALIGTGVSLKHFFNQGTAVEALLAFDPVALGVLLEKHRSTNAAGLDWFYGGGAYVAFEGRNNLGLLGIIGLDYKFNAIPLNLSLDWKPELYLVRRVDFEPAAVGLSIRFAF